MRVQTLFLLDIDLLRFRTCNNLTSLHTITISFDSFLQKKELQTERRKILSDEAKRLFRKEPGLLKAAEDDFKSILLLLPLENSYVMFSIPLLRFLQFTNLCRSIVVDLPPDARLDDLASLLNFDSKNIDKEKLGIDTIKKHQELNLKFSSNQTAVIPDDRAQIMLAGVSIVHFLPRSNVCMVIPCL